jgi:sucrose phosphorylase
MKNQAQLIAYVDRFSAGTFRDLQQLLDGPLNGVFGGVHVLPFFDPIDGSDAGFDPIDHTQVDSRLGSWDDVRALATRFDVMADVIVNHVSSRSAQFRDYDERGADSPYAGLFLTYSRVFPQGARESDLLELYRPRPGLPFTKYQTAHGQAVLLWTTFTSEQIDIDVHHREGSRYLADVLDRMHAADVRAIRVDAVGYAVKKAGTSCFMIPETFDFIAAFTAQAHARGIEVLVEVHGHYQEQIEIAARVDWVYDFALPPLVLHTLHTRDATHLKRWLEIRPPNAVTVLDTHDGIGVLDVAAGRQRPHAPGLLPQKDIHELVETIHRRSQGESRQATGSAANNLDLYQVNCTFYDALGRNDSEYLIARAIQCFTPGIPQIYYVGLLAGTNDLDLLRSSGVGRDINRHYYTAEQLREQLTRPVVQSLLALLRFRNSRAAFNGAFRMESSPRDRLALVWINGGEFARLDVDLTAMCASVTCSSATAGTEGERVWQTAVVNVPDERSR